MEKLEILLELKDKQYERALSIFLAGQGMGANVRILDSKVEIGADSQGKVLLTDKHTEIKHIFMSDYPVEQEAEDLKSESIVAKPTIFKYMAAQAIADELIYLVQVMENKLSYPTRMVTKRTEAVSFVGTSGGVGNTVISLAIARLMARQGYQVLYLNMEDDNSSNVYTGCENIENGRSLSDYIYRVLQKKDEHLHDGTKGFTYVDGDGVRHFNTNSAVNQFKELSGDEMAVVIRGILEDGVYDYIVVDISGGLCEATDSVLNFSKVICTVTDEKPKSFYKKEAFIRRMNSQKNILRMGRQMDITNRSDHKSFIHVGQHTEVRDDGCFMAEVKYALEKIIDEEMDHE